MTYVYQWGDVWWARASVNGRRSRMSTGCDKETDARKWAKVEEGRRVSGEPVLPRAPVGGRVPRGLRSGSWGDPMTTSRESGVLVLAVRRPGAGLRRRLHTMPDTRTPAKGFESRWGHRPLNQGFPESRFSGVSRAIPRQRGRPRKTTECPAMTRPNENEMGMVRVRRRGGDPSRPVHREGRLPATR
jgi:hypothetical protein